MNRVLRPTSIRARIGVFVGLLVTVCWLVAAAVTASFFLHETNEVFDRDLKLTAERILPIVLHDQFEEDDDRDRAGRYGRSPDLQHDRIQDDDIEFIITSARYGTLLKSRGAAELTPPDGEGFYSDKEWRYYVDEARRGDVTIVVARPLSARRELVWATMLTMSLPLFLVIPLTLLGIYYLVRRELLPLGRLEQDMGRRGPSDLNPISAEGMPSELVPMVESSNRLLERLKAGFEAERSFASNAAHEMRTPLAGAIAQAQRLQATSTDPIAVSRAGEMAASLKRLSRYCEKLMQIARAEGARLRQDEETDQRPVVEIVLEDFIRAHGKERFRLSLPTKPVQSDLDPDTLGIVLRNLVENALTYGDPEGVVAIDLTDTRILTVSNDGPPIPAETRAQLSQRFARGQRAGNGSGLGLSIVRIIADRADAAFDLISPRAGSQGGVTARFAF